MEDKIIEWTERGRLCKFPFTALEVVGFSTGVVLGRLAVVD